MRQSSLRAASVVVSPEIIDAYVEAARQARAHAQERRRMAADPGFRDWDLHVARQAYKRGCWYLEKARQLRRTTP